MTDRELMQQAYAVPLHEQLASVPESARLVIDDQDGMGTRFIPVGRLCNEAAAALRKRQTQPEQEPHIGWVVRNSQGKLDLLTDLQIDSSLEKYERLHKLYTNPPRREWVGLTRDAVLDIEETAKHPLEFARSIEAALREKNNG